MFGRRKVAALVAEFLAGGVLTLVVLSVQRSTIGVPYFVALAAGLAAAMLVFVFGSISGGHGNPAITLALWTARKVGTLTAVLYIVLQCLGAWAAYALYTYFVNSSLQPIGGEYNGRVLVAEAVGTLILALGWAAVAFRGSFTLGTRAAVVGVSYALAVVIAAAAGVGLVNPAVALGTNAWAGLTGTMGLYTYVLGPVLGAVIGINLYGLLFAPAAVEDDAVVVEEVVVAAAAPAAAVVAAKKPARKAASTGSKSATSRAKKPAAKRSTRR